MNSPTTQGGQAAAASCTVDTEGVGRSESKIVRKNRTSAVVGNVLDDGQQGLVQPSCTTSSSVSQEQLCAEPIHGRAILDDPNHTQPPKALRSSSPLPATASTQAPSTPRVPTDEPVAHPAMNEVLIADAHLAPPSYVSGDSERRYHIKLVRAHLYRPGAEGQRLLIFIGIMVVVGSLGIGLGLGISRRNSADTGSFPDSQPPSAAPTLMALQSEFVQQAHLFPSTLKALRLPNSPQTQALIWVTRNVIDTESFERDVQRFALATLYFALDGPNSSLAGKWLTTLDQHECTWKGVVCSSNSVVALRLSGEDQLRGFVPPEIGLLTALTTLVITDVLELELGLPTEVGYLRQLSSLELVSNSLNGGIPSELGHLVLLTSLDLSKNRLEGTIPSEVSNLSFLQLLRLSENELGGPLLSLSHLNELRILNLSGNHLVGTIPVEVTALKRLESLHLAENQLTGTIPSALGELRNLTFLGLGRNELTGTIPSELGQLRFLQIGLMDKTKLTGTLPSELCRLGMLRGLFLTENQLTGSIPPQIGNLTSATALRLEGNRFNGRIPREWSAMSDLRVIRMDDNDLSGSVPSELATLSNLEVLLLQQNPRLTGSMPSELCSLASAKSMNLTVDCGSLGCSDCPCYCFVALFTDP